MRKWTLLFFLLTPPAWSSNPIPINVAVDETVLSEATFGDLADHAARALDFVAKYPPSDLKTHVFDWTDDPFKVFGKTVIVHFTTTTSGVSEELRSDENPANRILPSTSALTASSGLDTHVMVFVDRLFRAKTNSSNIEGHIRLVSILAHKLYGNVQLFLEGIPTGEQDFSTRVRREVAAFERSVHFIETVMGDKPVFNKLGPRGRQAFMKELKTEREALRTWRQDAEALGLSCPSLFPKKK